MTLKILLNQQGHKLKFTKKQLKKLTKEQQQQLIIQELNKMLQEDSLFDGAKVEVNFIDKKYKDLKVFSWKYGTDI